MKQKYLFFFFYFRLDPRFASSVYLIWKQRNMLEQFILLWFSYPAFLPYIQFLFSSSRQILKIKMQTIRKMKIYLSFKQHCKFSRKLNFSSETQYSSTTTLKLTKFVFFLDIAQVGINTRLSAHEVFQISSCQKTLIDFFCRIVKSLEALAASRERRLRYWESFNKVKALWAKEIYE